MDQEIRRKLSRITDILWAGGVTNPVTYIEQICYLIYLKLLDEEENNRELRARLTNVNYLLLIREEAIKRLSLLKFKTPARLVDAALKENEIQPESSQGQGASLTLDDPEPWPEEVDGGELLNELVQTLRKFVAMEDPAFTATALWILHAHAHDAAFISPLLAIMSPEKRCGKTTLLHLIGPMVPRPLTTSNITSAALFRAVEKYRPTLLVDEADSFLRDKEELRGVLNSGQSKATAFVIRTVGDDHEPRRFSTWAPKVVALIGNLPDTLEDRSIVIQCAVVHQKKFWKNCD